MSTYFIPTENFEALEKKLNSIKKKCDKYKCTFNFENHGEVFRDVEILIEGETKKVPVKFIEIEVEGIAKLNDWQFVGTLQKMEGQDNIVRTITDIEVPERYFHSGCVCEHCKSGRARKETYLVQNQVTGEFKQIGSTCLQAYTNGISAEWAAQLAQFFKDAEDSSSTSGWSGFSHTRFTELEAVLRYSVEIVKHFGYVKTTDDYGEYNPDCTRAKVSDYIWRLYWGKKDKYTEYIEEEMPATFNVDSDEVTQKVADIIEYFKNQDETSSYMRNLKIYANNQYVEFKDFGYIVSMVPTYNRYLEGVERKAAIDKQNQTEKVLSQYVGEVGQRIDVEVDSIVCVTTFESAYGLTHLYKILDTNGNVYVWYASNGVDVDAVKKLKGTVKGHDKYNGVKQTQLTRCKVC